MYHENFSEIKSASASPVYSPVPCCHLEGVQKVDKNSLLHSRRVLGGAVAVMLGGSDAL